MSLGATDKQRSLFLKGFSLSKQGQYEDPTYLGFKVVIDFGVLPINADDGLPPSPLFKPDSYIAGDLFGRNPFGQPQYDFLTEGNNGRVHYYSAQTYLEERESGFANGGKRADMLKQFSLGFQDLLNNYPWFLQSITGLDQLAKVDRPGYQGDVGGGGAFNPQRTAGKKLTFSTLESLNLRISALADLYNQATFDYDNMRELLPRNLRRFTMYIFVSEIRNFFKTSRLIGSSAALTLLDSTATLLGSQNNPGNDVPGVQDQQNATFGPAGTKPGNSFNSFVGNVINKSGLDNDISLLKNQQDQSGIKPMIVFECRNCEFDFTASTPLTNVLTAGTTVSANPEVNKFDIHVGRVRMRSQYPNIRSDGKPLVLADSWDGSRSSVQQNPKSISDMMSIGGELLTNFVSNSLNDLINEGVANFSKNLSGLDQAVLGNAYSFNPSEVMSHLSYNNAQEFLNQFGNANIGFSKTNLKNPQTMGQGGPGERVYPAPTGDEYPTNPGPDLGVPQRAYPAPTGDEYPTNPGPDLGVPQRVYPAPTGDEYPTDPGPDLGVPQRVYQAPTGDEYPTDPGPDLGVPFRNYIAPTGDEYPTDPGPDLGVPYRSYIAPTGDEYPTDPGVDLGVPYRNYIAPSGDEYPTDPGVDLGVPYRNYIQPSGDVYPTDPGVDLGVPARNYVHPSGDVYPTVPGPDLGVPQRVYPPTSGDFYPGDPGVDLGVPSRNYLNPTGDVYPNDPGLDLGVPQRVDLAPSGPPVYPQNVYSAGALNGSTLTNPSNVYPPTSGDFGSEFAPNLGNLKPETKYNVSTGRFNDPDKEFE